MNLIVIGSCTGDKDYPDGVRPISDPEFDDPELVKRRELELDRWRLPAARLYTGWQHRYMMRGVEILRRHFGQESCVVNIISAGFGLVREDQPVVPYDATFVGKTTPWIRDRAARLRIPTLVRQAIEGLPVAVFLLGEKYLRALNLPLRPRGHQRLVFFSCETQLPLDAASILVPAGRSETRFGAGTVALKGKMFELLARGLAKNPSAWDRLLADTTPSTAKALIEAEAGFE